MQKLIIAFVGPKGSGKSYLASYLKTKGFEIKSFAAPLKKALVEIFGHKEYFYNPDLKELKHPSTSQTARILMTSSGDFFRSLNIDCFRNKMAQEILASQDNLICIDDLRYDNEAEIVKLAATQSGYDLIIVRIKTPEKVKSDHSSENGIHEDYITHTILNDKTQSAEEMLYHLIFFANNLTTNK